MPAVKPTLYHSRPKTEQGRLPVEMYTYDILDSLHIPYLRVDHEALNTIEDCHEIDVLLGTNVCKNLFLCNSQKTAFYLLLIPGRKKFQTAVFSKLIGSPRLSFAPEAYLKELLNLTPGSVTILGLINDPAHRVQLYIDREVAACSYIGCHPCINTSSLRIRTSDIFEKFLPYTGHTAGIVEL